MKRPLTFQEVIETLNRFWAARGCLVVQPYDIEKGAGTYNPATALRALGPQPWNAAYVEPSRRPTDGRYGDNPNRLQHYYQYQVIMKPAPDDCQDLYLESLVALGIDPRAHDLRFVEDDWESATLGASGLGWEVWIDGMECTQFTYFQEFAGFTVDPVPVELTYGLERIAMFLQNVDNVYDLLWTTMTVEGKPVPVSYGDVHLRTEREFSAYNFEHADTDMLFRHFTDHEQEAKKLVEAGLPLPAYDQVLKCSHTFGLLDARSAISVGERARFIGRVRTLARLVAQSYDEKYGSGDGDPGALPGRGA